VSARSLPVSWGDVPPGDRATVVATVDDFFRRARADAGETFDEEERGRALNLAAVFEGRRWRRAQGVPLLNYDGVVFDAGCYRPAEVR